MQTIATYVSAQLNNITCNNHVWSLNSVSAIGSIANALSNSAKVNRFMDTSNNYFRNNSGAANNGVPKWKYIQDQYSTAIEIYCAQLDQTVTVLDHPTQVMANFEDGISSDELDIIYNSLKSSSHSLPRVST